MSKTTLTIDELTAGQRLDVVAAAQFPALSRAYIQKLCEQGKVLLNGEPTKGGQKVRPGERVEILYEATAANEMPSIKLPILYQDKDCIVMNKPIGVLTHDRGGSSEPEASVAAFLRKYVSGISGERAGIVHRLDRATSGVIIGAKTPEALSWLQKQFSQRKVKKTYIAVVQGSLKEDEAVIDMPIERNPKAPATFRVGVNGKPAITHYKVLHTSDHYTMLELKPETGRTHQLRVHLKQLGHPIVGDVLYGGKEADRLYLHAQSLEITLPSRERKTFEVPTPPEFAAILDNDA